jgi:hypothetical protein
MSARLYQLLLWSVIGATALSGAVAAGRLHSARAPSPAPEAAPDADPPPVQAVKVEAPAPAEADDNPAVEPGKVRWHASFADAQAAARRSGKPVLLFQMMGRLDRQFC